MSENRANSGQGTADGGRASKQHWRSVQQLRGEPISDPAWQTEHQSEHDHDSKPSAGRRSPSADPWPHVDRREFLRLMGASMALAGINACTRQPSEEIVPYVKQPEHMVPGEPRFFATAMPMQGFAMGLLAESHMGRPTKLEGNPDHPASLGATSAIGQASVLGLYDPDRSKTVNNAGQIRTWSDFHKAFRLALEAQKDKGGAGLHLLTETITSPTVAAQIRGILASYPQARWHQYEPVNRDAARAAQRLAFGQYVDPRYHIDSADVIVSLDDDFLDCGAGHVRYAREFARRRRPSLTGAGNAMNRLYAVASTPTNTSAAADHRLALPPAMIVEVAKAIAAGRRLPSKPDIVAVRPYAKWISTVVAELNAHRGTSLVIAGDRTPPLVHALAYAINQQLDNIGRTISYTSPVEADAMEQTASLRELCEDIDAGKVEVLLILNGNPVYNAPVDFGFAQRLEKVALRVHSSLYEDETSRLCHWHLPETHYLEAWGDVRAFDGTATIQQPLIAPLYDGKSITEVLAVFGDQPNKPGYDIVRDQWRSTYAGADFESFWRKSVHDGVVPDTSVAARSVYPKGDWGTVFATTEQISGASAVRQLPSDAPDSESLTLLFAPDPTVHDGRFANNAWLQELPKPVTRLTWDNAAQVAPATAEKLGVRNGDVVELRVGERSIEAPIWIVPGQTPGCVTAHLGYGRTYSGRIGTGIGFNAYLLRDSASPWSVDGVQIKKTGRSYALACTQDHSSMEGRDIVRSASLSEYRKDPHFEHLDAHVPGRNDSLYPPFSYDSYAWGMAIDLTSCTGCNACLTACQAENNIAVVGKEQVEMGREMHWIRIDRYFSGDLEDPDTHYQPVPCMHCEDAPCEGVCPVNATVHSEEGLNEMVYNRCVGTRYCANNCPYKVRRFNFFLYQDWTTETLKMQRNPDVTVRSRGVMEKCSYCVQRINRARILAEREGRPIRDGEIVTACQQACPTEAIVFGNINDPNSRVAKLRSEPRNYQLLAELGTRPRTTYLAQITNPNSLLRKA